MYLSKSSVAKISKSKYLAFNLHFILYTLVINEFALGNQTIEFPEIVLKIKDGEIRGFTQNFLGKDINTFLGIPFAKPPVNELRFRHSVPNEAWKGVKDATKSPPTCWQLFNALEEANPASKMWYNNTEMSEDCLYLNVWTPFNQNYSSPNLAVMVWIFGGGFYSGANSLEVYNGLYLAAKTNVVVVSMNYRVGPLGFLYLGTDEAPGNQGLMDQNLALRWVRDNIDRFGGCADKITIFGESAGAASVSFHLLSPLSQNLFSQAILQSASALGEWAHDTPEAILPKTLKFAELLGCSSNSLQNATIECLREIEASRMTDNQFLINDIMTQYRNHKLSKFSPDDFNAHLYLDIPFQPVIDNYFLTKSPAEILRLQEQKKAKLLLGVNKNEAMFFILYSGIEHFKRDENGNFLYPHLQGLTKNDLINLVRNHFLDVEFFHPLLVQSVLFEYDIPTPAFGNTSWSTEEVIDALDNIAGDLSFKCPVVEFAEAYALLGENVYFYSFEQRTEAMTFPNWTGTMHGYEIEYVFGMPFNSAFKKNFYTFNEAETRLSEEMMTFWSNFAKTGDPNLDVQEVEPQKSRSSRWPIYTTDKKDYIILKSPASNFETGTFCRWRQCMFWRLHMPRLADELNKECGPASKKKRRFHGVCN